MSKLLKDGENFVFQVGFNLINGMVVGIEFPAIFKVEPEDPDDPVVTWCMSIELLIFRILVMKIQDE